MNMKELPVGVFDSGLGGISVLREIAKLMPHEDIIFFGDSINAPYGTKPVDKIREIAMDRADYLYRRGIKALVVACNTATSAAIDNLREKYVDIPVIGIEPALKPAMELKDNPHVIVMGTPATIKEKKFQELLAEYRSKGRIECVACPGLADLIETGDVDGEPIRKYITDLLFEFKGEDIDAVVMGCTHYPFISHVVKNYLGDGVNVIDGSLGTARQLRRKLDERGWLKDEGPGNIQFEESLPEKLELCRRFFEKK